MLSSLLDHLAQVFQLKNMAWHVDCFVSCFFQKVFEMVLQLIPRESYNRGDQKNEDIEVRTKPMIEHGDRGQKMD